MQYSVRAFDEDGQEIILVLEPSTIQVTKSHRNHRCLLEVVAERKPLR